MIKTKQEAVYTIIEAHYINALKAFKSNPTSKAAVELNRAKRAKQRADRAGRDLARLYDAFPPAAWVERLSA